MTEIEVLPFYLILTTIILFSLQSSIAFKSDNYPVVFNNVQTRVNTNAKPRSGPEFHAAKYFTKFSYAPPYLLKVSYQCHTPVQFYSNSVPHCLHRDTVLMLMPMSTSTRKLDQDLCCKVSQVQSIFFSFLSKPVEKNVGDNQPEERREEGAAEGWNPEEEKEKEQMHFASINTQQNDEENEGVNTKEMKEENVVFNSSTVLTNDTIDLNTSSKNKSEGFLLAIRNCSDDTAMESSRRKFSHYRTISKTVGKEREEVVENDESAGDYNVTVVVVTEAVTSNGNVIGMNESKLVSMITVFAYYNFGDPSESFKIFNKCTTLPTKWQRRISSLNTNNTCVEVCEYRNCAGRCILMTPGSPGHSRLRDVNFDKRITSVKACIMET